MLIELIHLSGCCCSVTKSYLTLCDSMDCSTPGFPVLHYLPEFKFMSIESIMLITISSSVTPFSFCLQSFPASGSLQMSRHLFASGAQNIGVSASAWVLPMNIQGWFPLGFIGLTSLQPTGFSRVFSSTTVWKHQFFSTLPSLWSNSHNHTRLQEKP